MKKVLNPSSLNIVRFLALLIGFLFFQNQSLYAATNGNLEIIGAKKLDATTIELILNNQHKLVVDFYGNHIFRLFQDNGGGAMRAPQAKPDAQILVDQPRKPVSSLNLTDNGHEILISTPSIALSFNKANTLFKLVDLHAKKVVLEEAEPILFENGKVTLSFKANPDEYFYGGGVQNGRFSHKGKMIAIENQNSWTDGGVASPTPFYWSTKGYGLMWYTFKKGKYDFGSKNKAVVKAYHETNYLDVFFMVNQQPAALLNDFYQLTGNPVLLPKFAFYQGHLNAYNRDYWKEDEKGILFEDGKKYKESQKDNGGVKESLNGEKNNYQFSARAVIDRYQKNDMPLGWILPNDGYGAGYGQTETLDGNIQNLKSFGEYARKNGVEIGLWTQSDLHPKEGISPLLQRDIIKEVRDAGVRVLKTDVAWVGAGYSFGLNGVADVGKIMPTYGNNARPFIISLDGWAGTQRYAGIWSGDQTGGVWEYIRFHIPTYIGSGLSGQPNITSDMDGIFGGQNPIVNTRDFQWKTFTPMQLNMDGWGTNEKYPQALGEPITSINRNYLKLKSALLPYTYSIAKEAVTGLPMIKAMFLADKNAYTSGTATQYQFMYGPYFLVAPIYQQTQADQQGNDIRNNIYLPKGTWYDYFTGEKYEGGTVINSFDAPLWKLPVFVKAGGIIPMVNPNNHVKDIDEHTRIYEIYPYGKSSFTAYDDDGKTEIYKKGQGVTTLIESSLSQQTALVTVHATKGNFDGLVKDKSTWFKVNLSEKPKQITAKTGNKTIKLREVNNINDFIKGQNVFYYNAHPNFNEFATKGSEFEKIVITKNPQLWVKVNAVDITATSVTLSISGYQFNPTDQLKKSTGALDVPQNTLVSETNTEAYTLKPTWGKVSNADYYEIDFNQMIYTHIKDTGFLFEGLEPETDYTFRLRAVNKSGTSGWTTINAKTKVNPLQFAIKGITAQTTAQNQEGEEIENLFDFDEASMWHTKWGAKAVPFDLIIDLKTINKLDKLHYLPRSGRGNGIWLKGTVYYSNDKETWTEAGPFSWERDDKVKVFNFSEHPNVRYLKIALTEGVGGYGSGRELYVFKVPGTESYLPGDINNDRKIDRNDLTSYTNYTGLRKGDADFEGYISNGDINHNGIIDAYDISVVATQLDGGAKPSAEKIEGKIEFTGNKPTYNKDEMVEITVKGIGLKAVNALSFAFPYANQDFEFVGIKPLNMKEMDNLTNDRLHTNGDKVLYPTFINTGNKETLEGTQDLFIIRFKAKRKATFDLKATQGFLVDKALNVIKF